MGRKSRLPRRAALAAGASVHCVAVRAGSDALPDGSVAFREQLQCPLHLAAEHNQLGVAALLLASGADVNFLACGVVGDGEGDAEQQCDTPLTIAAAWGRAEVVRLLLAAGADPSALSAGCDATPLISAARAPAADPVRARSAESPQAGPGVRARIKLADRGRSRASRGSESPPAD
jgi:hypothetical protein